MELRRAMLPITLPIMAPVFGLGDVDNCEVGVALDGLSELVAEDVDCVIPVAGCFVLGVDVVKLFVVDCDSKLVEVGIGFGVELDEAADIGVRVADGTPCVCEIVFEIPSELGPNVIPAGLSNPEACGLAASSA